MQSRCLTGLRTGGCSTNHLYAKRSACALPCAASSCGFRGHMLLTAKPRHASGHITVEGHWCQRRDSRRVVVCAAGDRYISPRARWRQLKQDVRDTAEMLRARFM